MQSYAFVIFVAVLVALLYALWSHYDARRERALLVDDVVHDPYGYWAGRAGGRHHCRMLRIVGEDRAGIRPSFPGMAHALWPMQAREDR